MILLLILSWVLIIIEAVFIRTLHRHLKKIDMVISKIQPALQTLSNNQNIIHSDVKKSRYEQLAKKKFIRK